MAPPPPSEVFAVKVLLTDDKESLAQTAPANEVPPPSLPLKRLLTVVTSPALMAPPEACTEVLAVNVLPVVVTDPVPEDGWAQTAPPTLAVLWSKVVFVAVTVGASTAPPAPAFRSPP